MSAVAGTAAAAFATTAHPQVEPRVDTLSLASMGVHLEEIGAPLRIPTRMGTCRFFLISNLASYHTIGIICKAFAACSGRCKLRHVFRHARVLWRQ